MVYGRTPLQCVLLRVMGAVLALQVQPDQYGVYQHVCSVSRAQVKNTVMLSCSGACEGSLLRAYLLWCFLIFPIVPRQFYTVANEEGRTRYGE